jgi:hypothetical protein
MSAIKHRPFCPTCNERFRAVNYHDEHGKIHYRSYCNQCAKKHKKKKPAPTNWEQAGYKKSARCDKCGFVAKYQQQLTVFHTDGKLKNTSFRNLKTICRNCIEAIKIEGLGWKQGELTPDF